MKKLLLFIFITSFAACTSNPTEEEGQQGVSSEVQTMQETKQYEAIIATHDKIMPRMNTLRTMSKALEDWSGKKITADQKSTIKITLDLMSQAEESMMNWMNELGPANPESLRSSKSHDEIMDVLAIQEEKASMVSKQFTDAINKASALLQKLTSENGASLSPSN